MKLKGDIFNTKPKLALAFVFLVGMSTFMNVALTSLFSRITYLLSHYSFLRIIQASGTVFPILLTFTFLLTVFSVALDMLAFEGCCLVYEKWNIKLKGEL